MLSISNSERLGPYIRLSTSQKFAIPSPNRDFKVDMTSTSRKWKPRTPVLGVGDSLGAGDSYLVTDLLPPDVADVAFGRLKTEVQWQNMYHRGKISL